MRPDSHPGQRQEPDVLVIDTCMDCMRPASECDSIRTHTDVRQVRYVPASAPPREGEREALPTSFRGELEDAIRREYGSDELIASPGAMRHFYRVVNAAWGVVERWVEDAASPLPDERNGDE